MGTVTRPELSKKNRYWIDRHRYYELKHFCLQYQGWKKAYNELNYSVTRPTDSVRVFPTNDVSDSVAAYVEERLFYADHIAMIESAARETDPILGSYILMAVTEGVSYEIIKARLDIPCCKDVYYELYRRFFWLLSNMRK